MIWRLSDGLLCEPDLQKAAFRILFGMFIFVFFTSKYNRINYARSVCVRFLELEENEVSFRAEAMGFNIFSVQ